MAKIVKQIQPTHKKSTFSLKTPHILNMEQNGTLKKQKNHLFLQKNQLTMNNFRKNGIFAVLF